MNIIRWGLLSTANINRRVIPAIRQSERGELTAVASRTPESAQAYAQEWEIPLAFGSYEAMLASAEIDALYIPLPNHLHAEWTIKSLRAGKHVLCEKPFALTLAEVDEMTAVAAETGLVLAEAFMYRHHPQMKLAGQMVREGKLGEITLVRATFNFQMGSRQNIRLVPDYGGGCLWDVGIYPVSFAQYVMGGLPQAVSATQRLGESGVDEFFAAQLYYSGSRVAQISSSFMTPFHTRAEVLGTKGRLTMTRPFISAEESEMVFHPANSSPEYVEFAEEYLYLGEIEDMHAAILDGRANYLTLSETRNHVQTIKTLYEAAQNNRRVTL